MALSDLILAKGEVVVIQSDSTQGVVGFQTSISFGTVQLVNDLCDTTTVGASVWFDVTKAIPFMIISGQVFYKVKEQDISASEPPAL